jgi:hypothetical protein
MSANTSGNASVRDRAAGHLLEKLRGTGTSRPQVDPELSGGLREWLEDSLSATATRIPEGGSPLVIDSASRRKLAYSGPHLVTNPAEIADQELLHSLVTCVFRQWVTTRDMGDPLADSLAAHAVRGDPEGVVERVSRMTVARRVSLESELTEHARRISRTWPSLCASWRPRTQEKITIPLCGRRIVLSAVLDLAVGPQASTDASVCIVGVETRLPRRSDEIDMHYLALVETLRSGAPPSRVGKYFTSSGQLRIESVDEHLLVSGLLETIDLAERLCP